MTLEEVETHKLRAICSRLTEGRSLWERLWVIFWPMLIEMWAVSSCGLGSGAAWKGERELTEASIPLSCSLTWDTTDFPAVADCERLGQ